ncbi:MAG TPA: Ppx/GppA phosphatase family protein [Bacteroidota bacterium]|nr:Ppx/GppA phosphatase family protein [Bacteroidota bacterium]
MRIASIDIGTNTILLVIADISADGELSTVHHEERIPRIGRDVDYQGVLQSSSILRGVAVLKEFQQISSAYEAETVIAAATSAVRDAANRSEFLEAVQKACGITVEVLSGDEEALLTFRGACVGMHPERDDLAVIDIGGGSTELTFSSPGAHNGSRSLTRYSLQLGSVRLTERQFRNIPPGAAEIRSARTYIAEEFAQIRNPGFHGYDLIGVAGTLTTLACLDIGLKGFDANRVSGYRLKEERIRGWLERVLALQPAEIRALSECTEGRADILPAGILILSEFMKRFGFSSALVSEKGLRYGLALREWERRIGK